MDAAAPLGRTAPLLAGVGFGGLGRMGMSASAAARGSAWACRTWRSVSRRGGLAYMNSQASKAGEAGTPNGLGRFEAVESELCINWRAGPHPTSAGVKTSDTTGSCASGLHLEPLESTPRPATRDPRPSALDIVIVAAGTPHHTHHTMLRATPHHTLPESIVLGRDALPAWSGHHHHAAEASLSSLLRLREPVAPGILQPQARTNLAHPLLPGTHRRRRPRTPSSIDALPAPILAALLPD
ncbi:hypothetical protein Micbo1qcDRAFT_202394 [Microdochium bolleyi]|uniref:Uncharacterized protein n=1 Tax=Microdochium bolleyi TaxID=196109 RepID=A0A136JBJ1_9PEZI|nr:hypothetical protein Micbo1qcDRAFT_202394 [Microdochium bolleyi]